MSRRLGRDPNASEMSTALGISLEQVEAVESTMVPVRSIHAPVAGLEATTLEDTLEDEDAPTPVDEIDREQVRTAVTEVLRDLSARERKILDWRFGLRERRRRDRDAGRDWQATRHLARARAADRVRGARTAAPRALHAPPARQPRPRR